MNALAVRDVAGWESQSFDRPVYAPNPPRVSSVNAVPMWKFIVGDDRLVCDTPVRVMIREQDGLYLVDCERLNIYCDGPSLRTAVEAFRQQVHHYYREYSRLTEDQVVGLGAELRELYSRHFHLT